MAALWVRSAWPRSRRARHSGSRHRERSAGSRRAFRAYRLEHGVCVPFNSGGRPLFSWPAYIPAAVEFGAFTAAVGGLIWFFREGRLTRLHDAAFEFAEVARASQDRFVLAVACDGGEDANTVLAILANAGADHTRLVTP
ncbi:quinol:electron acceptor oxidoreductase subunit ActD [Novosphingobium panipatense]|uniref:quinol:electron acceptor oxidoreductase subunit ActD n=1 Tax=Novosphingobium panipatense TaxID=428991 RepID=UPI003618D299